jgi:hypothetical protein
MAFLRQPGELGLTSTDAALSTDGGEAIAGARLGARPEIWEDLFNKIIAGLHSSTNFHSFQQ